MSPLLLAALAAFSPCLAGSSGEEELKRAKEWLADGHEDSCTKGTDLCVAENSVAAVELLLDVLRQEADRDLPVAHYRDVVWGGLRRMDDRAARARVQAELDKNRKAPLVRQWCAELLGEYGDAEFVASLTAAVEDKDLAVRRAAARALGRLRFEGAGEESADRGQTRASAGAPFGSATAELVKKTGDKDYLLRANAIEALARMDPERFEQTLLDRLKDEDAGVRCALLGVAAELYPDRGEELAGTALLDEDWRPRLQAVDVLGEIKTTSALRRLIEMLGEPRPVVVARAKRHLQELTGEKYTKKEAWELWWKEKGGEFDFSKERRKEARTPDSTVAATFNGISFESDHTAFLIDSSADMAGELKSQHCSKAAAALKELDDTLTRLQGKQFSLFTYAGEVTAFAKKGPIELTPRSQEKALAFVRDQRLAGSKDIWQALETVLADPTIDTVFLLSSGEPEIGRYVHWNRVTWHLADLNRFRKVVVHAIAYSEKQWYRDQIEKIAEVTGGEFKWFE